MRSGPYKAGKRAEAFLSERLAGGVVVPVDRLLADAKRGSIDPMTLRRAAKRLSVAKPVCWALPDEQATGDAEEPVEAEGPAVAAVAETDPRVERAVAAVRELIAGGMPRDIAVYRRVCQGDPELAALVLEKLAR